MAEPSEHAIDVGEEAALRLGPRPLQRPRRQRRARHAQRHARRARHRLGDPRDVARRRPDERDRRRAEQRRLRFALQLRDRQAELQLALRDGPREQVGRRGGGLTGGLGDGVE